MSFSEPCALAVDFGGTSIKMGVTAGDRILATADRIPTAMFESPQAIIEAMIAAALNLRGQFPSACVMGMGMPGWCDYYRGTLYQLTNVRVWDHEVPVKELMEQALGLPVVLDNDANCMAYAEWKLGAGRGMSSLVCLTMGTGIGGGIVVNDRILRGKRLSTGELGQTSIHYQGKPGPFGNRGAIEEYIGNNELAAEAVKRYAGAGIVKTVNECTPRDLDEAAARLSHRPSAMGGHGGNAGLSHHEPDVHAGAGRLHHWRGGSQGRRPAHEAPAEEPHGAIVPHAHGGAENPARQIWRGSGAAGRRRHGDGRIPGAGSSGTF